MFWVCALVPVLRLKRNGSSEIHDQNSWKESLRPYLSLCHQWDGYWGCIRFWARFSKVPIINRPLNLFLFTCKIEISVVLHLTWSNYQLMKKWSILLARTRTTPIPFISIWIFDLGPEKLQGLWTNGPLVRCLRPQDGIYWKSKFNAFA